MRALKFSLVFAGVFLFGAHARASQLFLNPRPIQGAPGTSTGASGSVITPNTFQQVFAANPARLGCIIQNTSTTVEDVFLGATGSAAIGSSLQLSPGAVFSCNAPGVVVTDAIQITSATAGATFVGDAQ